jgi:hypothetical protein
VESCKQLVGQHICKYMFSWEALACALCLGPWSTLVTHSFIVTPVARKLKNPCRPFTDNMLFAVCRFGRDLSRW